MQQPGMQQINRPAMRFKSSMQLPRAETKSSRIYNNFVRSKSNSMLQNVRSAASQNLFKMPKFTNIEPKVETFVPRKQSHVLLEPLK